MKREGYKGLIRTRIKRNGDIEVIYPKKQPKWAQKAAMLIWSDIDSGGMPTKKGLSTIVRRYYAAIITTCARDAK